MKSLLKFGMIITISTSCSIFNKKLQAPDIIFKAPTHKESFTCLSKEETEKLLYYIFRLEESQIKEKIK